MAVWGYGQGLIAGAPLAGRFRGGRVRRLAARAAAAGGRLALAVCAAVRAAWRRADRRAARLRASSCSASTCAAGSASGSGCSTAWAAPCWWPAWGCSSSGSAAPWRCRRPARGSCASRSSARRSCKELNDVLPPSGPILQALARFDPFPSITGPSANVPRAGPEDRARPGRGAAAPQRGSCARHGLRPGRAGKRLGRRQGNRGDERPRRGGAGRHDGAGRGRGPGPRRGGDLVRPAQRPLDPARARALRRCRRSG